MRQLSIFEIEEKPKKMILNPLYDQIQKSDWIDYIMEEYKNEDQYINEFELRLICDKFTSCIEHYDYVKEFDNKEDICKQIYKSVIDQYNTSCGHGMIDDLIIRSFKRYEGKYMILFYKGDNVLVSTGNKEVFGNIRLNAMDVSIFNHKTSEYLLPIREELMENVFKVREYGVNNSSFKSDSLFMLDITIIDMLNYFKT